MHGSKTLVLSCTAASASAFATYANESYEWKAPSSTDKRSPCPMLNALANHGFLARDGKNISMSDLIVALNSSVNLAAEATELVGAKALTVNSTTGRSDTFNLDDLDQHNVIEHDGSLSRSDYALGDDHTFNATIWGAVAAHFTNETITIATAAAARAERLVAAKAANPSFNLTSSGLQFSLIETALYLGVFGNLTTGEGNRTWVKILFEEERIPYAEGFTRSETEISSTAVLTLAQKVALA